MTVPSQPSAEHLFELEITSEPGQIAAVRTVIGQVAGALGFPEADANIIILAIDEAITNVILHGYDSVPGQPIRVSARRIMVSDRPAMEILICDCARQVDPSSIRGRDLDDIRPGGLGTHIIRSVMDEVEYSHRQPVGMQLRMVKILRAE